MVRPNQESIETFTSITDASEATAILKLELIQTAERERELHELEGQVGVSELAGHTSAGMEDHGKSPSSSKGRFCRSNMVNWSELPHDLLELIAQQHLNKIEDYVAFGAVCTSWRVAAANQKNFKGLRLWQHIPCLMLEAEDDESDIDREFYSLMENEVVAKLSIPKLKGKKCIESLGWFLTIGERGDMSLLHPFSQVEIALPHQNTFPEFEISATDPLFIFVEKMVLSSCPTSSDFVVMIIAGGDRHLGFWRPGDQGWNRIELRKAAFWDVTYHNGKFYAIDSRGNVVVCDVSRPNSTIEALIINRCSSSIMLSHNHGYIVKSSSLEKQSLMVVTRNNFPYFSDDLDQPPVYGTTEFKVYELDLLKGTWEEIRSLGNKALFLGHSASMSLEVSTNKLAPRIKPNHIYFTDDCCEGYLDVGGGKDMGVYNLGTGAIETFFQGRQLLSKICPSVWITPNF